MKRWACICRLGGIGDNLCAATVLKPLKNLGYNVEVITSETAQVVWRNNPYIDKLSVKKDGEIPGGDEWNKWFANRAGEYDLLVNLSGSQERRHALHKSDSWFWLPVEYRRKLCAGSYIETACDMVGVAFDRAPLFWPSEEEKDRAQQKKAELGGKFIVWALAGSRVDKLHPYSAMAIARIIRECDIPVVMMGSGGAQFNAADTIQDRVKRQNSSLDGLHLALSPDTEGLVSPDGRQHEKGGAMDWPIRRSLSLACAADIVITPDSGIGWATAMEPMPKIMLLSHAGADSITKHWLNTVTLHADPDRVPCWPCHRLHDTIETCVPMEPGANTAACMADISVERIVSEVKAALDQDLKKVVRFPHVA